MAKVHIGIPTLNGAAFIGECLACLASQTFQDFEVFISDNASTDGTSEICADFALRDVRFHHLRAPATIPWADNFIRALDLTSAPYFMWRADDDLADADYLECLVEQLDAHPDAELAVAPILRIIDKPGGAQTLFDLPDANGLSGLERLERILLGCHPSWFYGLWRREAARVHWTRVVEHYPFLWACDHLTLLPPILDDRVVFAPETRFIQRIKRTEQGYRLASPKLMRARAAYSGIAREMVRARRWGPDEEAAVLSLLEMHIEKRVARKWKTYGRVAEYYAKKLFGR
jgi:glycosyltransferase involved in cell wall biosynthesis